MAFIGKKPTAAPLTSSDVADGIITNAKLAQDIISGDTALGATPADTDEFLVSDAGVLKRMDYSYIKASPSMTLVGETNASDVAAVTFVHGTDSVVFDSTYKAYFLLVSQLKMAGDEELFLRPLSGGSALTTDFVTKQTGTRGTSSSTSAYNDRYTNSFMGSPGDVDSSYPFSMSAYFFNVGITGTPQSFGQVNFQRSNADFYGFNFGSIRITSISDFDGITITNNGGPNITSGSFKLWGIN